MLQVRRDETGDFLGFSKGAAIALVFLHHVARSYWIERGIKPPTLRQWTFEPGGQDGALLAAALHSHRYGECIFRLLAQYAYPGFYLFILASGVGLAMGTPETMRYGAFLRRRAWKLVPPFWIAVAFFSLLAWITGHPFTLGQILRRLFLVTTLNAQEFFIIDSPLWSLAVFLQLYVVFHPLRWVIQRHAAVSLALLAVLGFAARALCETQAVLGWNHYLGHAQGFNWLVLFGVGIWAGIRLREDGMVAFSGRILGVVGGAALVLGLGSAASPLLYPVHDTALGLLTGALALMAWKQCNRNWVSRILVGMGGISYPLFLYHRPLVAKAIRIWLHGSAAGADAPLGLGLLLLVVLSCPLMVVKRAGERYTKLSRWVLGS